jgi:Skp family chaperone for outer membrane proteins
MNRRKWIQLGALIVLCGIGAAGLWAESKPANSGEGGAKVAAINMRAAIASTAEGKQAAAQLETEFLARRKEIEDLNKRINEIQQRLQAGGSLSKQDEEERLTVEGKGLVRQLEHRQNEYQEDLNEAQGEVLDRIGRRMAGVVRTYAQGHGYGTVLDDSSRSTPVMYVSADITQEIVKLYDETYPLKSGTGPENTKPPMKSVTKPSER